MSDEFSSTCSICQHSYDAGVILQGLLLPCGHHFCRCCLQKLEDNCNKNCPMCRHDWSNARVSVLPEYTPVGGAAAAEGEEEYEDEDTCKKHGFELLFWCQSCEVSTCKCCMKEDHKRCEWLILEDALDAIDELVKQNVGRASSMLLATLEGVQKRRAKCSEQLADMRFFQAAVEESERQLVAYSTKLASLESKMSRGVEELKRTAETADKLSIQALQRSKRRVEQLGKAVDVPQSPKLHMSAVAQAYKETERKHTGADFLTEFSSEVLKSFQEVEASELEEEEPSQAEAKTAAGDLSLSYSVPAVKITVECATQVEPEEVPSEDEDDSSIAPSTCIRCSAADAVLAEGGDWDIADPDTATAAVTRLLATRVRPSCLTLTVDASWHQLQVTNLLKVLGRKTCNVRLKFLDTFMLLENEGTKKDEERLKALGFGNHMCTIEEYWGYLNGNNVKMLLESPALETVALPLSSADDAKVLTGLQSSHEEGGLSELHLHVSKKLKLEQVPQLNVSQLKPLSRCYLHCPLVAGGDLNWLVQVLDKLVSANGRKIWSVVLSLPSNSLTAADLDRLLGLLRDHGLTDLEVQLYSADIDGATKLELTRQFDESSCRIKWYTEYSLPLKEDQLSETVCSGMARSTLPVLVTLDQVKELLEEVLTPLKLSSLDQAIEKSLSAGNDYTKQFASSRLAECPFCTQGRKLKELIETLTPLLASIEKEFTPLHIDLKRLSHLLETSSAMKAFFVASLGD